MRYEVEGEEEDGDEEIFVGVTVEFLISILGVIGTLADLVGHFVEKSIISWARSSNGWGKQGLLSPVN